MLGPTLEDVYRKKLGGCEGVGAVLLGGSIEDTRDNREDRRKGIEEAKCFCSDIICVGNEYSKFEGS